MNTVIYTRYSSDNQREASIEDQRRKCEEYAERHSWEVSEVYADKAISGSRRDRPGYLSMLKAGEAREFEALIVDDLSRLSRDDVEMKQALRRLKFWGIRVIGVADGYDSDSKGSKAQAGVRGLMNEIFLDDLSEKTR